MAIGVIDSDAPVATIGADEDVVLRASRELDDQEGFLDSADGSSKGISRRDVLRAGGVGAIALAGAPLLAACGSSASAKSSSRSTGKAKATLRMWTWYTQQKAVFPKLIAQYQAENPHVTIENRVFGALSGSYEPAIDTAISGGDPPEIFGPMGSALTYGAAGIALDLTQALGKEFLSGFFPSTNQQYSQGGKQYGIGWMAQTFGLYYNPEMLKKAKVDFPETWDDLIAIVDPLKKANAGVYPFVTQGSTNPLDFFLPLITQATNDPTLVLNLDTQTDKSYTWENPGVVKALELMDKLNKGGVFPPGFLSIDDPQDETLFYTKKAAILSEGSWVIQDIVQDAPPAFNKVYAIGQTPAWSTGTKHWCANQAGAGLSISGKSPYAEEAVKFIKWLYEPARYSKTMNETNSMPSTIEAGREVSNPLLKTMTSWLVEGNGCPHILGGTGSSTAIGDAVVSVLEGKATPAQAAKSAQASLERARHI